MKSFIFTLVAGVIGVLVWMGFKAITGIENLVAMLVFIGVFAGIGYLIGALKIPDSPLMGPFRKAGGEYVSDIIGRFFTFGFRKKIYLYNYDRARSVTKEMQADKKEEKK